MRSELSVVLSLALGRPLSQTDFAWNRVFEAAQRERVAPLAWLRSANVIRKCAPADIVESWRAAALSSLELGQVWGEVSAAAGRTLASVNVAPIILKGYPLAERLYGDAMARPCADLDIFVPQAQRAAAHRALLDGGWRWRTGTAPREGGYEVEFGGRSLTLEIHSALLDDALVAHLPFAPPGAVPVTTSAAAVSAHADDQLAPFLATHLAKHSRPPLLWLIDFAQLWSTMDHAARERAWQSARAARAHRYLAWAIRHTGALVGAAFDERSLDGRRFVRQLLAHAHPAFRVAALSATPGDALRSLAGWVVRPEIRGDPNRIVSELLTRPFIAVGRRLRKGLGIQPATAARADGTRPMTRGLRIGSSELAAIARDLTSQGSSFWIRATGSSMHPTITDGTAVRLAPLRAGDAPINVGDVLLAAVAPGSLVLHRVRRIAGDRVWLQGDANVRGDRVVTRAQVLAIADGIRVAGFTRPIPRRPRRRAGEMLRAAVGRWARRQPALGSSAVGDPR